MASAAPSVVLVTGVSRYLGARLAARLSDDPAIARVIGVDRVAPGRTGVPLGRTEFVRADIGHPLIATVLDHARVDTVVHAAGAVEATGAGQAAATAALLDACRRTHSLRGLVVLSSTDVYGASSRDPAVFTEQMQPASDPPSGPSRAAGELEAQVRSFARQRPDVAVASARLAPLVGRGVDSRFLRYLRRSWAATALGFDPRVQLLHEYDAVEAVARLALARTRGPVNVAGAGVLTLSQALRIAGNVPVPLPGGAGAYGESALLRFGRVVDTGRLTADVGYRPRYTTVEALYAAVDGRPGRGGMARLASAALAGAQRLVGAP